MLWVFYLFNYTFSLWVLIRMPGELSILNLKKVGKLECSLNFMNVFKLFVKFMILEYWFHSCFLAYFLEYAIVRISSVCPSVCLSVRRPHYYFSWGWPIGAIYGSIDSLWPNDPNDGRNFFWTGPGPDGRVLKSKFRIFSYKYCILLVFKKGY